MERPSHFLPSEVARLVLGYLKVSQHKATYKCFLKECEHLVEYAAMLKQGVEYPTAIMGVSLLQLLEEYAELKLKDKELDMFPIDMQAVWKQFDAATRTLKQQTRTQSMKSSCYQQRQRTKTRGRNFVLATPTQPTRTATQPMDQTSAECTPEVTVIKVVPQRVAFTQVTNGTVGSFLTLKDIDTGTVEDNDNVPAEGNFQVNDKTDKTNDEKTGRKKKRQKGKAKKILTFTKRRPKGSVNGAVINDIDNAVCDTDEEVRVEMDCGVVGSSPKTASADKHTVVNRTAESSHGIMNISENSSNRSDAVFDNYHHNGSDSDETAGQDKDGVQSVGGRNKGAGEWLKEMDPLRGHSSSHTDSHNLHIVHESPVKTIGIQDHRTPVKALVQESQTCDNSWKSPRRKKHQPKRRGDVDVLIPPLVPPLQPPEPRDNSSGNKEDSPVQADPFPMLLDKIMNDTKLHERLAATINKSRFTDHSQTLCQKPVATSTIVDDFFSYEDPHMLSEDTIDGIITMTKNDPVFDSLLSMFESEAAKTTISSTASQSTSHVNTVTKSVPDGSMMELSQDGFMTSTAPESSAPAIVCRSSSSEVAPSPCPSLTSPCPSVSSSVSSLGSPGQAPTKKRRIKPIPCNPVTSALPVFSSPVIQQGSPIKSPEPCPPTPTSVLKETVSVPTTQAKAASPSPSVPLTATHTQAGTPAASQAKRQTVSEPSTYTIPSVSGLTVLSQPTVTLPTNHTQTGAPGSTSVSQSTMPLSTSHIPAQDPARSPVTASGPTSNSQQVMPVQSLTTAIICPQQTLSAPNTHTTASSIPLLASVASNTSNINTSNSHAIQPLNQPVHIQSAPVSSQVLVCSGTDSTNCGVNISILENGVIEASSNSGTTCQQLLNLNSIPTVSVLPDSGTAASSCSVNSVPMSNTKSQCQSSTTHLQTVTALPGSIVTIQESTPASTLPVTVPVVGPQSILAPLSTGNIPLAMSDTLMSSNTQMSFDLLAENNLSQFAFPSNVKPQEQNTESVDSMSNQGFPTVVINDRVYKLALSPNGKNFVVDKASPSVERQVNQRPTVTVIAPTLPQMRSRTSKTPVKKPKPRKNSVAASPNFSSTTLSKLQDIVRQELSPKPKNSSRPNILSKSPRPSKTLCLQTGGYFISPSRSNVTEASSVSSALDEYVAIPLGRLCEDEHKRSLTFEDANRGHNVKGSSGQIPKRANAVQNKKLISAKIKMGIRKPSSKVNGSSVINVDIATPDGKQASIMSLMTKDGEPQVIRKSRGGGRTWRKETQENNKISTKEKAASKSIGNKKSSKEKAGPKSPNLASTCSNDSSISVGSLQQNSTTDMTPNVSLKRNVKGGNNNMELSPSCNGINFVPLNEDSSSSSVQVSALKQPPAFSKDGTITTTIGSPMYANSPSQQSVACGVNGTALTLSEDSNMSSASSIQTAVSDPGPTRQLKNAKMRKIIAKRLSIISELNSPGETGASVGGSRKRSSSNFSLDQKRKRPNLSNLNVDDFLSKIHR